MKERPILFSGEMVRAILEGRKVMTRRIVKPQPDQGERFVCAWGFGHRIWIEGRPEKEFLCPYGKPGDCLWVRETWATDFEKNILYRATDESPSPMGAYGAKKIVDGVPRIWRPSIFMPRWASRLTLEITGVRVERLQAITEEDAKAEGIQMPDQIEEPPDWWSYRDEFAYLWNEINGKRAPWLSNPYVWVIEFKRMEASQ